MSASGSQACQAAMFVLKDDGPKKERAWQNAAGIKNIRAEQHTTKDTFLASLAAWNAAVDPENAFLAVYAHMGKPGMAPTPKGPLVTWEAFSRALPRRVHTLWLAGCSSAEVLAPWSAPKDSPVMGTMLVTTTKKNWLPLVRLFEQEVDLDDIKFFDEMKKVVTELLGCDEFLYLDAEDQSAWKPFPPRQQATGPLSVAELADLSLLWART
jgi:hypothetical protein